MSRNHKLIISSSFISYIGNGMQFIAFTWIITEVLGQPKYVGMLVLLSSIVTLVFTPFAGYIADWANNKLIVVVSDVCRGCFLLLMVFFKFKEASVLLALIYIINTFTSIGSTFFYPSFMSIIKNYSGEEDYLKITSHNSTALQLGNIIGSMVSGFIIGFIGIKAVFMINACSYFVSAFFLLYLRIPVNQYSKIQRKKTKMIESTIDGFKIFFSNKKLVYLLFLGTLSSLSAKVVNTFLSGYTKYNLHGNADLFGFLDSAFAVGAIVLGICYSYFRKTTFKDSGFFLIVIGLSYVLLATSSKPILSFITMIVLGGSSIIFSNIRKAYYFTQVPKDYIGRVESINSLTYSLLTPIISSIIATMTNETKIGNTFFIFGIIYILIALSVTVVNWKMNMGINDKSKM